MSFNKTETPFTDLVAQLSIWDQTIGCELCGEGWWSENYTVDPTMFHAMECPIFGRRDVAEQHFNLAHIEDRLGRRVGIDVSSSDDVCPICDNEEWVSGVGNKPKQVTPERFASALGYGKPCCRDCFVDFVKWMKAEPFQGYDSRHGAK